MTYKQYWVKLKATDLKLYIILDRRSRLQHRVRRRTRARTWNTNNKERRNMIRRLLYAQKKKEAEQSKS